jgi:Tfp pilus assembly protein PilX
MAKGIPKSLTENGVILPTVLIITAALMLIGLALLSGITGQYTLASDDVFTDNALQAAEAGVEQSVDQLNLNNNFAGYPTSQTLFNNTTQGYGVFTTTIANSTDGSNAKTITSIGTTYHYGQTKNPVSTREVKVTVVGTTSQGYSVMTGPGGLILNGSASITNSEVYADGTVSLTGAASIGTQNQPLTVNVGNYACPTSGGSTWPQLCSGTQPISMAYSTHIYGSVCATGQTSTGPNSNITGGNGGSGLEAGCTAAPVASPTYNRLAQIAAVTTTGSGTNATYDCTQWQNPVGFTRTWPANLELTGNVNVASSCNLTISGNVYITGNLTIGGAAKITVANSVGTTRPVVIVDGTINAGGSGSLVTNTDGTGIEFISFESDNSCTVSTNAATYCTSLSGSDLFRSQSMNTVTIGGAASLAGFIFDAYWGQIDVTGSGNVGAAIGQTVDMDGAGTITFGTEVGTGSETWTISSYQILPVGDSS